MSKSLEGHTNNERKYAEVILNLKHNDKKHRDLLQQISKKLKNQEKKSTEETKIAMELRKRHEIMQKKLEMAQKEKADSIK